MAARTRICYVINSFAIGGAETVVLDLARGLDPARHDVTVLAAQEPALRAGDAEPEMRRRFRAAGVATAALSLRSFRDPRALLRLGRFLGAGRFDIVHGHNRPTDGWAVEVGGWAGVPHRLWTRHSVYSDLTPRQIARYRRLSRSARVVLAVSETVRLACIANEGLDPARVVTIENGIDTVKYAPASAQARAAARAALGARPDETVVLFVGRLNEHKVPEAFVEVIWRLRAAGRPVRGIVCGDGPLADPLRRMAETGPGGVDLLGFRNDVATLLAGADLFLSTSRNEGLPLNVMEAMAAGVPVIGTAIGQTAGLMTTSPALHAALLPPPPASGNVPDVQLRSWSAAIGQVLDDPDRRAGLGREGRRVIVEHYSQERMVARHEQLYGSFRP